MVSILLGVNLFFSLESAVAVNALLALTQTILLNAATKRVAGNLRSRNISKLITELMLITQLMQITSFVCHRRVVVGHWLTGARARAAAGCDARTQRCRSNRTPVCQMCLPS